MLQLGLIVGLGLVSLALLAVLGHLFRSRRLPTVPALTETRRPPPPPSGPLVCQTCLREYPPGLRFCPQDARPLVPREGAPVRPVGSGVACPTCRRTFEPHTKFCPFDAEELVPMGLAAGAGHVHAHGRGGPGKICPSCARKYELDATFCGRDGAELVSVN